jgi:hypothetical protein
MMKRLMLLWFCHCLQMFHTHPTTAHPGCAIWVREPWFDVDCAVTSILKLTEMARKKIIPSCGKNCRPQLNSVT